MIAEISTEHMMEVPQRASTKILAPNWKKDERGKQSDGKVTHHVVEHAVDVTVLHDQLMSMIEVFAMNVKNSVAGDVRDNGVGGPGGPNIVGEDGQQLLEVDMAAAVGLNEENILGKLENLNVADEGIGKPIAAVRVDDLEVGEIWTIEREIYIRPHVKPCAGRGCEWHLRDESAE